MLKPLGDRIVVKPLESEEKTEGGIYLPDTAQEKPQKGEVVAVGPGRVVESGPNAGKTIPPEVKVGDKVQAGDVIADVEKEALGVPVHASISGKVTMIEARGVHIEKE